jgi:hypothetical protein
MTSIYFLMRLLVQLPTNKNNNNADNLPEEEVEEELPAIGIGQEDHINTNHQSIQSNTDCIGEELAADIQAEKNTGLAEQQGGYKSESTAWSDNPDKWYPTDPHHYYFDITSNKFGILIGAVEDKLIVFIKLHLKNTRSIP